MTNAQEPSTIAAQIEALAPCPNPWCNSTSPPLPARVARNDQWYVLCACGIRSWYKPTEVEAVAAWQTRPAIVTALRQAEAAPGVVEAGNAQEPCEPKTQMYRKTALVQAEQFLPNEGKIPSGVYSSERADPRKNPLADWVLNTLEGPHYLRDGDYICTGPAGEQWNVERSIFKAIYEPVNAAPSADAAMVEELVRLVQFEANNGADSPVDYGDAEQIVKAVLKALASRQPAGVPEGFVLVPREPTEAMLDVMHESIRILVDPLNKTADIQNDHALWSAMIDAAPATNEGEAK